MGPRGEGWVIGQFVIGAAILVSTFFTRVEIPLFAQIIGGALLVIGAVIAGLGLITLGANLTPFPKPKEGAHFLVTQGVYRIVRHPIYCGIVSGAFGWTLWWGTLSGIVLALALFLWFDLKSRFEERWLVEKYPDYALYQARVKRLIPFVY